MTFVFPQPEIGGGGGGSGVQFRTDDGLLSSPINDIENLFGGTGTRTSKGGGNTALFSVIGSGFTWLEKGVDDSISEGFGYFITANVTITLPTTSDSLVGDAVSFIVDPDVVLTIQTGTGTQKIRIGTGISSEGGSALSFNDGDSLTLIYKPSTEEWIALTVIGNNWTFT